MANNSEFHGRKCILILIRCKIPLTNLLHILRATGFHILLWLLSLLGILSLPRFSLGHGSIKECKNHQLNLMKNQNVLSMDKSTQKQLHDPDWSIMIPITRQHPKVQLLSTTAELHSDSTLGRGAKNWIERNTVCLFYSIGIQVKSSFETGYHVLWLSNFEIHGYLLKGSMFQSSCPNPSDSIPTNFSEP